MPLDLIHLSVIQYYSISFVYFSFYKIKMLLLTHVNCFCRVLPVNSERVTENNGLLRPIKAENYAYKIEHSELLVGNEDENLNVECDDEMDSNQCVYDEVGLQIVESGPNDYEDDEKSEVTKVLCDISVQTEDLVSSESCSLIDLNDELFRDDEQTENKQYETKNVQDGAVFVSKSNKNENGNIIVLHDKNRFIYNVPSVIDLDTAHASDSDCKIVGTNNNITSCVLKPKARKNKSFNEIVVPALIEEDTPYNGPLTFDNPAYVDCTNQKIKKRKKKQKSIFQISNSNNISCKEIQLKETDSSHLTNHSNSKAESCAVLRTSTENKFTKRRKCTNLEYENKKEIEYELCSSDVHQNDAFNDCRSNKDQLIKKKLLQEESKIISNKNTELLEQRKTLEEINSSVTEIKEYNWKVNKNKSSSNFQREKKFSDNLKLDNGIQNRKNININKVEIADCLGPSNTKNENYTDENSVQLKTEHFFKEDFHSPESLNTLKNDICEQLSLKLIELNKHEIVMPEQCKEVGQINYSNNSSIKNHIDNDSSYTESDKSSLVTMSSMQNSINVAINEYPLKRKRKRKRRLSNKIKREKLAAAATKLLVPADFPKPSYLYQAKTNFQGKNKHIFFSNDDFNEDMNSPETPEYCISNENSG